jgi:hypothetical protein
MIIPLTYGLILGNITCVCNRFSWYSNAMYHVGFAGYDSQAFIRKLEKEERWLKKHCSATFLVKSIKDSGRDKESDILGQGAVWLIRRMRSSHGPWDKLALTRVLGPAILTGGDATSLEAFHGIYEVDQKLARQLAEAEILGDRRDELAWRILLFVLNTDGKTAAAPLLDGRMKWRLSEVLLLPEEQASLSRLVALGKRQKLIDQQNIKAYKDQLRALSHEDYIITIFGGL